MVRGGKTRRHANGKLEHAKRKHTTRTTTMLPINQKTQKQYQQEQKQEHTKWGTEEEKRRTTGSKKREQIPQRLQQLDTQLLQDRETNIGKIHAMTEGPIAIAKTQNQHGSKSHTEKHTNKDILNEKLMEKTTMGESKIKNIEIQREEERSL